MALIEDEPPITLPRAHSIARPPIESSGSQKYIQSCRRWSSSRGQPSGMGIHGSRSQPPASARAPAQRILRLAEIHPVMPALEQQPRPAERDVDPRIAVPAPGFEEE